MVSFKIISRLFMLAAYSVIVAAEYASDYDSGMNGYRSEPEPYQNRYDESHYDAPVARSSNPSASSDSNSYQLYHRDSQGVHDVQPQHHQQDQPQHHHHEHPKHHHNHHDHGTSSMSFYQKVKHHEHKFKFEQKHGKHGHFHGYSHPYAYGGLKVSDW